MKPLPPKKLIVALIVTLTFVCSSNALLFGGHSIHETVHALSLSVDVDSGNLWIDFLSADLACDDDVPNHGTEPEDEDHFHASIAVNGSIIKQPSPVVTEHTFFERPEFPLDVFLEKFIPPHISV